MFIAWFLTRFGYAMLIVGLALLVSIPLIQRLTEAHRVLNRFEVLIGG